MSQSHIPAHLMYTEEHEWTIKEADGTITVGITDYAQHSLGDVVYVETHLVGESVKQGKAFGVVESVKAASDLFAPLSGEIVAINERLEDEPELLNNNPYGEGWLVKMTASDESEWGKLLDAAAYKALLEEAES